MIEDAVRSACSPFLAATSVLLIVLVCHVILLHGVRELAFRRRARLIGVYRSIVEDALLAEGSEEAVVRLKASPPRHRPVIAALILQPLRVAEGSLTTRARWVANSLGLIAQWQTDLGRRRWWTRAEAAHALGLVKCPSAVPALIEALDDDSEEVRAAAVEALGLISHPDAIPELVSRLSDQSGHQTVRLVQALKQFGSAAVPPLLDHASGSCDDRALVAQLLGNIKAVSALNLLTKWIHDERADVRAASVRAIGMIGVDGRVYPDLLVALNDDAPAVRAAAAWALGRSGREEAVPHLTDRLRDDWVVASQSARALRDLGGAGYRALTTAAASDGGDLARQMLWEAARTSCA